MSDSQEPGRPLREIAFLLLLLQGSIALLTAVAGFLLQVFAPGFRGVLVLALVETAVAILIFALAAGVLRSRRWAYAWAARLEFMVLLGSLVTLDLRMGVSPTLSFAVAQVALPLAVMTLVLALHERPTTTSAAGPRTEA